MRTQDKDVKGLGRVVHGSVSASGGIVSGTGFTVTKTGTGAYTITFLQGFQAIPIIEVTADVGSQGGWASYQHTSATTVQISTFTNSSTNFDLPFNFSATEAIPA